MVVIIGAGISGLSAARNLAGDYIILEKTDRCGGLSTQYQSNGYWFDFGGHYFHFKNREPVKSDLEGFGRFRAFTRKSKTFLFDTYIPFPLQYHLSHLPRSLARKILSQVPDHPRKDLHNLRDYLKFNLGEQLFTLFFQPFLNKYLQKELKDIRARMDRGSIPIPDKKAMAEGFQGKPSGDIGYNPRFYYPAIPLRRFMDNLSATVRPAIQFNQAVEEINLIRRKIKTGGSHFDFDFIINTMPLKELMEIIHPWPSPPGAGELEHISTLVVNVVLKTRRKRFHWVYLPEKDLPFYRAGYYPLRRPPACYLERSLQPGHRPDSGRQLTEEVVFTLKRLRMIKTKEEILHIDHRVIPVSYVIFNHNWEQIVPPLLKKLEKMGIYSIGRYGSWNYSSMSDDVLVAQKTAAAINRIRGIPS